MTVSTPMKDGKRFLCVEADGKRCTAQCWQCQHIAEFESLGDEAEDGEDTNVEDSDGR